MFESLAVVGVVAIVILIIVLIFLGIFLFVEWKFFEKCGEKGWKGIIPFYNSWTLVEISECKWWYFLFIIGNTLLSSVTNFNDETSILMLFTGLVSIVALYASLCVNYNIAKKFNEGIGFAIGLTFVPLIFQLILICSKKYEFNKNIEVNSFGLYDFETKEWVLKEKKSYCSNCGTIISGNFCPKCGKSKKGE